MDILNEVARWAGPFTATVALLIDAIVSSPHQLLAHLAALAGIALVVAGAFVRTMMPLRWLAVGSNLGLLLFGALHPSTVTLITAGALLPINLWRAVEVTRLTRRVSRAGVDADLAGLWLKPYMRTRRLKSGQTLFVKGAPADRLYLLVRGPLVLVEIGLAIEPGRIFGEIGLFSPDGRRTQTARALGDCQLLEIDGRTVRQLFYQNPAFGFHLIGLLAGRLGAVVARFGVPSDRPQA
jgi:CRP-like cAMP-binding protein